MAHTESPAPELTDDELLAAIDRGLEVGTLVKFDSAYVERLDEIEAQTAARVAVAYRCTTCGEGVAVDGTCGPYCPDSRATYA